MRSLIYGLEDEMRKFITFHKLQGNAAFQEFFLNIGTWREGDNKYIILSLTLDDVKWYDGYPEVEAWQQLLDSAAKLNLEYETIRIGEEEGDIETNRSLENRGFLRVRSAIVDDLPCFMEGFE